MSKNELVIQEEVIRDEEDILDWTTKFDKPTALFDFDGTVHLYESGWAGETVIPDPPVEGMREELELLRETHAVVIFSTRAKTRAGRDAIRDWMEKWHIPFDGVTDKKIPAVVIVDDRAIRFDGNPRGLAEQIRNFKPWNR